MSRRRYRKVVRTRVGWGLPLEAPGGSEEEEGGVSWLRGCKVG